MGKRVVFKQHRVGLAASSSFARFWFLALATGMVVPSLALGGKPLPPSPPPCAPDGVCYPKRDTWGYNVTRWRAWPGEDPAVVPTPVDELPPDEELPLRPLERPDPRDEDLRGPRRPAPVLRAVPADPSMPVDPTMPVPFEPAVPGQPVPDADPFGDPFGVEPAQPFAPGREGVFPDFNQQGQLPQPSETDDAPPRLPAGLQQALRSLNQQQPMSMAQGGEKPASPVVSVGVPEAEEKPRSTWNQPGGSALRLVNPAANVVVAGDDDHLQHALYFEASDQD